MGIFFAGVVSTVSWMSGASSGLKGFNPVAVTWVAHVPTRGTSYQTRNAIDILVIPVLPKPAGRRNQLGGRGKEFGRRHRIERLP